MNRLVLPADRGCPVGEAPAVLAGGRQATQPIAIVRRGMERRGIRSMPLRPMATVYQIEGRCQSVSSSADLARGRALHVSPRRSHGRHAPAREVWRELAVSQSAVDQWLVELERCALWTDNLAMRARNGDEMWPSPKSSQRSSAVLSSELPVCQGIAHWRDCSEVSLPGPSIPVTAPAPETAPQPLPVPAPVPEPVPSRT
jgi:hypothetical protein